MVIITIKYLDENNFKKVVEEIKPKVIFYNEGKIDISEGYTNYYFPYEGFLIFHYTKMDKKEMQELLSGFTFIEGDCKEIDELEKEY